MVVTQIEKITLKVTPQGVNPDILIFRDFWQPQTLELFKIYYINHLYHNISQIVSNYTDYPDHTSPAKHRLELGKDPLSTSIASTVKNYLSKTLDKDLITGFYYAGFHLPGAILELHTDKEVGEYVVSMPLYTENLTKPWRFCVGDIDVDLTPGDFVVYDGQIPHHRLDPLPNDAFSINIFMLFTHSGTVRMIPSKQISHGSNLFSGIISDFIQEQK